MDRRAAFTLVELVVEIMLLGILAGVAAPKLLNTSRQATENGLRQTLAVVRDAIELYAAQNSATGWMFNTTDGSFICNSTATDGDSAAYSTY